MRYLIPTVLSILPLGAWAEVPRVITDIAPVYGLTAMVMGDLGQPVLLLDKGASAHDYQLRPSQMQDIANADLAIWLGPAMTPWFERALQGAGDETTILALLDVPQTLTYDFGAWEKAGQDGQAKDDHDHDDHGHDDHDHDNHDHGDQAKAQDEHADDHAGHDHSGIDPHAWLDPANAAVWLDAIAAALSAKDSANAATYAANAQSAQAEIAAMDAELAAKLAPVQGHAFVTYHDAYQYFTAHYGLAYRGAIAMGDASAAGAAHIRQMQQAMAEGGIACVFPESQHDSSLLMQLTAGTTVRAGGALDPEGATLDPSRSNYTDLMRALGSTLAACLGGA
jgi:zinc transport system substrate-binding protein